MPAKASDRAEELADKEQGSAAKDAGGEVVAGAAAFIGLRSRRVARGEARQRELGDAGAGRRRFTTKPTSAGARSAGQRQRVAQQAVRLRPGVDHQQDAVEPGRGRAEIGGAQDRGQVDQHEFVGSAEPRGEIADRGQMEDRAGGERRAAHADRQDVEAAARVGDDGDLLVRRSAQHLAEAGGVREIVVAGDRRMLGVAVDQHDLMALERQKVREVGGDGRGAFATAMRRHSEQHRPVAADLLERGRDVAQRPGVGRRRRVECDPLGRGPCRRQ